MAAWCFVFVGTIRELSATILLTTANTKLVSVIIYDLNESGDLGAICVLGIILLLASFAVVFVANRVPVLGGERVGRAPDRARRERTRGSRGQTRCAGRGILLCGAVGHPAIRLPVQAPARCRTSSNQQPHLAAIDFLRTRSLANVVQAEIERMIIDGELKPQRARQRERTVSALGRQPRADPRGVLGTRRHRLIEIIPNRGFFIRALTNDEALDLSQARASVFGCIAMMLAERITDADLAELRALTDRMDAIVELGDVHVYYPVNLEFHRRIAQMAGNRRLELLYQSFVRELHIQRYRALASPDVLHISNEEHRAIVAALEQRDPLAALQAARSHIMNGILRTRQAGQPGDEAAEKPKARQRGHPTAD